MADPVKVPKTVNVQLAGVGGQGVLLISNIIGWACIKAGQTVLDFSRDQISELFLNVSAPAYMPLQINNKILDLPPELELKLEAGSMRRTKLGSGPSSAGGTFLPKSGRREG